MNIGLDIDNVIADFDKSILKYFLIEDKLKRNKGIINPKSSHINNEMFDWSEEEIRDFYTKNMEKIAKELNLRRNACKVTNQLLKDGHKIFLITHRTYPHYRNPERTTTDWLKKKKINYTKLIFSQFTDKIQECLKYKIDVMVDDRADQCKKMKSEGINVLLMLTRYNKNEKKDLPYVRSWLELYREISKCKK